MNLDSQKRYQYIDIARGIAMLCIIIGHLGNRTINRVVFTFHVPIFFLISGFFISEKTSLSEFMKKRIRSLIVPYVCTCIVIIGIATLGNYITGGIWESLWAFGRWTYASLYGAGNYYTEPFYIKAIGAIWFLWATFWGQLFLKLSFKLNDKYRPLFVLFLFLVGYFSRFLLWFPLSIQAGCCATLFIYIGYICKKSKAVVEMIPDETKNVAKVFALFVWLFFIKDFQSFSLVHCDVGRGIIDIFGALCGCYIVLQISKIIEKYVAGLRKALAFIGKYSIFVLCIHIIELNLFPWKDIMDNMIELGMSESLRLPVTIVGKYVMDIGITVICAHSKWIKKLFGMN